MDGHSYTHFHVVLSERKLPIVWLQSNLFLIFTVYTSSCGIISPWCWTTDIAWWHTCPCRWYIGVSSNCITYQNACIYSRISKIWRITVSLTYSWNRMSIRAIWTIWNTPPSWIVRIESKWTLGRTYACSCIIISIKRITN